MALGPDKQKLCRDFPNFEVGARGLLNFGGKTLGPSKLGKFDAV